jgi:hypothetical protein
MGSILSLFKNYECDLEVLPEKKEEYVRRRFPTRSTCEEYGDEDLEIRFDPSKVLQNST